MEVAVFPASYDTLPLLTILLPLQLRQLRHVGRDPPSHRHPQKGHALWLKHRGLCQKSGMQQCSNLILVKAMSRRWFEASSRVAVGARHAERLELSRD